MVSEASCFFFPSSRKGAETQRNLTANRSNLLVLGSCLLLLASCLSALVSRFLLLASCIFTYFVLRTWYIVLYSPYLCTYFMGLTGFDSRCNHRARMQAGVCTALKNSCKRQMAKLLTPWLLNLTL